MASGTAKQGYDLQLYIATFAAQNIPGQDGKAFVDSGTFPSGYKAIATRKVTTGKTTVVVRGIDLGTRTLYLTNITSSQINSVQPGAIFVIAREDSVPTINP